MIKKHAIIIGLIISGILIYLTYSVIQLKKTAQNEKIQFQAWQIQATQQINILTANQGVITEFLNNLKK